MTLVLTFLALSMWSVGVVAIINAAIQWIDRRNESEVHSDHPFVHGVTTVGIGIGVLIVVMTSLAFIIWLAVEAFGVHW